MRLAMGLLEAKLKRAAFQTMLLLIQQANGRWRPAERLSSEPNWNGKQMNALYERFRIHLERSSIVRFRIFILSIDECATAACFRRERRTACNDMDWRTLGRLGIERIQIRQIGAALAAYANHRVTLCRVCVCLIERLIELFMKY